MESLQFLKDLNYLDIGFVLTIFLLSWRGAIRGFFAETMGFVGIALACVFAGKFYHHAVPYLAKVV
ncbi:MAG: CvpA family protein, partial [Candidatus Adiutrix sp.]